MLVFLMEEKEKVVSRKYEFFYNEKKLFLEILIRVLFLFYLKLYGFFSRKED